MNEKIVGLYFSVRGASKLYFRQYSCTVIILFNKGLNKSAFPFYSFGKLVFRLSAFSALILCFNFIFINFIAFI